LIKRTQNVINDFSPPAHKRDSHTQDSTVIVVSSAHTTTPSDKHLQKALLARFIITQSSKTLFPADADSHAKNFFAFVWNPRFFPGMTFSSLHPPWGGWKLIFRRKITIRGSRVYRLAVWVARFWVEENFFSLNLDECSGVEITFGK
jgi:hypothetical protein